MSHHDLVILHHLARMLVQLYCHHHCHITQMSKWFFRDQLIPCIAAHWKLDYDLLPKEQTFYRALRQNCCSSAMREKMAIFYYAMVDRECGAHMNNLYIDLMKRQRVTVTPYWDRFVEEYRKKKDKGYALPKPIGEWVKGLRAADKRRLYKILEREFGNP